MSNKITVLLVGLLYLIIGIIPLLWPEKIQKYGIKIAESNKEWVKFIMFSDWMKTASYIWTLRIIGTVCIGLSILMFYIFIKKV